MVLISTDLCLILNKFFKNSTKNLARTWQDSVSVRVGVRTKRARCSLSLPLFLLLRQGSNLNSPDVNLLATIKIKNA